MAMEYFFCGPLYFCKFRKVNTGAVKILSIEFANVKMQISHYGLCEPKGVFPGQWPFFLKQCPFFPQQWPPFPGQGF